MHAYIADTSFAAEKLFEALQTDRAELGALKAQQQLALDREAYFDIAFLQRQMHPSANYWYAQLREAHGSRTELDSDIARLEARILDKRFSLSALAGALLQLAKQGISVARGRSENCPGVRDVFGVALPWVVWAGRNQALHFERPRDVSFETRVVLATVALHGGPPELNLAEGKINLALHVLDALGWDALGPYREDLNALLG